MPPSFDYRLLTAALRALESDPDRFAGHRPLPGRSWAQTQAHVVMLIEMGLVAGYVTRPVGAGVPGPAAAHVLGGLSWAGRAVARRPGAGSTPGRAAGRAWDPFPPGLRRLARYLDALTGGG